MFPIPPDLQGQFEEHLAKRMIPNGLHGVYKKWLRYYLDFCQKYRFPPKSLAESASFHSKAAGKEANECPTGTGRECNQALLRRSPGKAPLQARTVDPTP